MFDMVVDDVRAGTVRAYTGLDIVLSGMIHPESPKLIKMSLAQMDVDGILDDTTRGIEVPLYVNLTLGQFQDILYQLGLQHKEEDVSLVRMNVQGTAGYRVDPSEQFINQFIGKMGKYKTNAQSTWDHRYCNLHWYGYFMKYLLTYVIHREDFFQSINFKIRIGPQKSNLIRATENLSRGQKSSGPPNCTGSVPEDALCDQEGQFKPFGKIEEREKWVPDPAYEAAREETLKHLPDDEKDWINKRKKAQEGQDKAFDEFLDRAPQETGTSHAAMIEHVRHIFQVNFFGTVLTNTNTAKVMRLTTHRVMAPRLRAALDSASSLIGLQISKKKDLEHVLGLLGGGGKSHLMTLMEADFHESESALRTYRDPRGEEAMNNARVFAAGRLRKALKEAPVPK